MGRVLLLLVIVLLIAYVTYKSFAYLQNKNRQRQLAMFAPELLSVENGVDPKVATFIVAQRKQLSEGQAIIHKMMTDPSMTMSIPTEYSEPLQKWLNNQKGTTR